MRTLTLEEATAVLELESCGCKYIGSSEVDGFRYDRFKHQGNGRILLLDLSDGFVVKPILEQQMTEIGIMNASEILRNLGYS